MNANGNNHALPVAKVIRSQMKAVGLNQTELAARCGEHAQTISAILHGRRDIPIPLSVKMDAVLNYPPGTIAILQTQRLVEKELQRSNQVSVAAAKQHIIKLIKEGGGFWSYQGVPEKLPDDDIIEGALVHLELEDLPLLFNIWNRARIKRVWKERLVSQGKRMNILNYILAVKFFGVHHPDQYLSRHALQ